MILSEPRRGGTLKPTLREWTKADATDFADRFVVIRQAERRAGYARLMAIVAQTMARCTTYSALTRTPPRTLFTAVLFRKSSSLSTTWISLGDSSPRNYKHVSARRFCYAACISDERTERKAMIYVSFFIKYFHWQKIRRTIISTRKTFPELINAWSTDLHESWFLKHFAYRRDIHLYFLNKNKIRNTMDFSFIPYFAEKYRSRSYAKHFKD